MLNLLQFPHHFLADALRGTIGCYQIGMSQLQLLESLLQTIVIEVTNLWLGIEIILAIMIADLGSKLVDLLLWRDALQLVLSLFSVQRKCGSGVILRSVWVARTAPSGNHSAFECRTHSLS